MSDHANSSESAANGAPLWRHNDPLVGLVPTLLDFQRAPGRYRLALREPQIAFEQMQAVLQLAAGRTVEGLPALAQGGEAEAAQSAARYFVRTAMLRAGTDHYALMGLAPGFEPEKLRDHYRLLIRMTHPDFAATGDEWPADAASRINQANDVLGSPVKRSVYDDTLEAAKPKAAMAAAMADGAPAAHPAMHPAAMPQPLTTRPPAASARRAAAPGSVWRHRTKIALATLGAVVCAAALWLLTPSNHDGSLVAQRSASGNGESNLNAAAGQPDAATSQDSNAGPTRSSIKTIAQNPAAQRAAQQLAQAEAQAQLAAAANAPAERPQIASAEPRLTRAEQRAAKAEARQARREALAAAQATQAEQVEKATPIAQANPARRSKADAVATSTASSTSSTSTTSTAAATTAAMATADTAESSSTAFKENAMADNGRLMLTASTQLASLASASTSASALSVPEPAIERAPAKQSLTMAQVQPKLGHVLAGLQTGKGENVVRLLDGAWRNEPAAGAFVSRFQQLLAGQRVTQLGKVTFHSREQAAQFVVDGVIELKLKALDSEREQSRNLHISAYFQPDGERPVFTQVVAKQLR